MKMSAVWVMVLASGCFYTPIMTFGGNSAKQAQHETLSRVTPPALVAAGEWSGPIATAKIRVWGDADYRAQNVRWQQAFQEELDYANEILAAEFGVRLVADYRAWDHRTDEAMLVSSLDQLAEVDPGTDAFAVVGLTSSLSAVTATFDQLGYAQLPGNHLVMRGYADVGERAAFDRVFAELDKDERASLYAARRRHKTAAILLHELAHNLGAPHRSESDTLMSPVYSDRSASFDDASRALVLAMLDARLHRAPRRAPERAPEIHAAVARAGLAIAVGADGRGSVGGRVLDDDTLDGLLQLTFADDAETEVTIVGTRETPQPALVAMQNRAKAAGFHRVAIARD